MSDSITLHPQAILDPRGQPPPPVSLAPRLARLQGQSIAFFDNTKLDFGHYRLLVPIVEEYLLAQGAARVVFLRRQLRGCGNPAIVATAEQIRASGADAAILALADMGVTPATVLLAAELERGGMPTAVVCAEPGTTLAKVVAAYRAPGLHLCDIELTTSTTAEQVRERAVPLAQDIASALQVEAEGEPAAQPESPVETLPYAGGVVQLAAERTVATEAGQGSIDPAGFAEDAYDAFTEAHIGDGLPFIPPTAERVRRMLEYTDLSPEEVILAETQPSGAAVTVERLAVNAVMAGCRPRYFPIVVAAFQALADPKFPFLQTVTTSYPGGTLVLVSGPLAREIGIASGGGCMGPGFRANATIGRTISLVLLNVCRARPGQADLAAQGSPAKYTFCFAENDSANPWAPLHTECFGPEVTCVYVGKCEGPHQAMNYLGNTPESILDSIASTATSLGSNNAYQPGDLVVALCPDHALTIASGGWSKDDVRRYLYEAVRNPRKRLDGRGLVPLWPEWMFHLEDVPVVSKPENIVVVVAGGPGPQSGTILPWAIGPAVLRRVTLADGRSACSVEEFRRR